MGKGGKKKLNKAGKKVEKVKKSGLFESNPRSFRIGRSILHKRDVTRFVRWPQYILLQRQKRILMQRLKVPPALNQFTHTLDINQAKNLFKLLKKYSPETKKEKKTRLLEKAKEKVEKKKKEKEEGKKKEEGKEMKIEKQKETKKPIILHYGLKKVTSLIENKIAKLVVIAHDVDPIELVVWLPQLCRKMEVPFCFVKNTERLGKLVYKKRATCVALTEVKPEDTQEFNSLVGAFKAQFLDNEDLKKKWGANILGIKSRHRIELHKKALENEALKKAKV